MSDQQLNITEQQAEPILDRWFMIINPTAGGGMALLDLPHISKLLHENDIETEPHFTNHKFHAVEYAVQAANKGYRKIIVLGGDGTLHEVVNGLFIQQSVAPSEITLGVIGVGVGNDWLRTYGFEEGHYTSMVRAIKDGKSMLQDIGVVSYMESHYRQLRYMVGAGGSGFDAYIVKRFQHRNMKGRLTRWSYMWCAIQSFFRYKHTGVRIYLDDQLIYNNLLFSVAVGIGKFNNGGLQQLPDAIVDDGLVDMTIIRPLHFWHILFRALYLFNGMIYKIGHTSHHRGHTVRIESTPDMLLEVDGELLGETPIEISVLPRAVRVIIG